MTFAAYKGKCPTCQHDHDEPTPPPLAAGGDLSYIAALEAIRVAAEGLTKCRAPASMTAKQRVAWDALCATLEPGGIEYRCRGCGSPDPESHDVDCLTCVECEVMPGEPHDPACPNGRTPLAAGGGITDQMIKRALSHVVIVTDSQKRPIVSYASMRAALSAAVGAGWVRCSERMPENDTEVLCQIDCEGFYRKEVMVLYNNRWEAPLGHFDRDSVTHWMPLPAPPAEAKS